MELEKTVLAEYMKLFVRSKYYKEFCRKFKKTTVKTRRFTNNDFHQHIQMY